MSNSIDFKNIKQFANGMLSASTYEKIHSYAKDSQGNIVEVGTAHGAATISMASAIEPGAGKVYTFEKIFGGSREKFGSVEENLKIIESNYEKFRVSDRIQQFIGDVVVEADNIKYLSSFSMLMLDADGRLDRDFVLFYDKLKPGGYIVIDDCDDRIKVKIKSGIMIVDQKHKLTHLFIKMFEELGFLEPVEIIGNTYFGRKPAAIGKSIQELTILETSEIYANMVFCHINYFEMWINRCKYYLSRIKNKLGF